MHDSGLDAVRRKKDSSISRAVDLVKKGRCGSGGQRRAHGRGRHGEHIKLRTLEGSSVPGSLRPCRPRPTSLSSSTPARTPIRPRGRWCRMRSWGRSIHDTSSATRIRASASCRSAPRRRKATNSPARLSTCSGKQRTQFPRQRRGARSFREPVEVVVADGFTGNIVLKTSEAIAHAIFAWVKREIHKSVIVKLGGLLARPAFKRIHKKTNADEYGGMPLLGVNGICIIAHGGSSPVAVKNAIRMAAETIRHQVNPHIIEEVQRYHDHHSHARAATSLSAPSRSSAPGATSPNGC